MSASCTLPTLKGNCFELVLEGGERALLTHVHRDLNKCNEDALLQSCKVHLRIIQFLLRHYETNHINHEYIYVVAFCQCDQRWQFELINTISGILENNSLYSIQDTIGKRKSIYSIIYSFYARIYCPSFLLRLLSIVHKSWRGSAVANGLALAYTLKSSECDLSLFPELVSISEMAIIGLFAWHS